VRPCAVVVLLAVLDLPLKHRRGDRQDVARDVVEQVARIGHPRHRSDEPLALAIGPGHAGGRGEGDALGIVGEGCGDADHGKTATQDPRGLPSLPRKHPPREANRDNGIPTGEPGDRKRSCRGSGEGALEKDPQRAPRRRPYLTPSPKPDQAGRGGGRTIRPGSRRIAKYGLTVWVLQQSRCAGSRPNGQQPYQSSVTPCHGLEQCVWRER
jgi:hypothetical protein